MIEYSICFHHTTAHFLISDHNNLFVSDSFFKMEGKNGKVNPVVIPEKLIEDCCSVDSTQILLLSDKLKECRTIYEQMNCLGMLKQRTCLRELLGLICSGWGISRHLQIYLHALSTSFNTGVTQKYKCVAYRRFVNLYCSGTLPQKGSRGYC